MIKIHFARCLSIWKILSGQIDVDDGEVVSFYCVIFPVWNSSVQSLQLQLPSGGCSRAGSKQYMWYPRSQSSQNNSWSSLSDVPQIVQYLHSIHCQRYFFTEIFMLAVNCRHVGWPDRPQSEHETRSSAWLVFLFSLASPRQKSQ